MQNLMTAAIRTAMAHMLAMRVKDMSRVRGPKVSKTYRPNGKREMLRRAKQYAAGHHGGVK